MVVEEERYNGEKMISLFLAGSGRQTHKMHVYRFDTPIAAQSHDSILPESSEALDDFVYLFGKSE